MTQQTVYAADILAIHPSDDAAFAFGFDDALASGETIASATATVSPSGSLTATELTVLATDYTHGRTTIPDGRGVTARLKSGTAGTSYKVTIVATLTGGSKITGVFTVECQS